MKLPTTITGPVLAALSFAAPAFAQQRPVDRISHVFVLYLENRSFNNLFGEFPGANGIANAKANGLGAQRDRDGRLLNALPPPRHRPFDQSENPAELRAVPFPTLPNGPFAIDKIAPGVSTTTRTLNPTHLFHTNRAQINGGANDLFAAYSSVRGFTMGYYSRDAMESSHLWRLARENTLLDRFFMGAFGGSFLNHQYLVCACAPKWENAPEGERSKLDASGRPVLRDEAENFFEDNRVTRREDGNLAVNTTQSVFLNAGGRVLLPPQTAPTIGDRLSDRQVEWAWYSGGFELAARTDRTQQETNYLNGALRFQWHHQPFAYYARFNPAEAQGREQRTRHLRDAGRLLDDIKSGRLPAVSFYKPVGALNQHPGYTVIEKGDEEVASIAKALAESPMKDSYLLVITYDENGGFWDHVAPPMGPQAGARADFLGPGSRIQALLVGPFARKGKIDSTEFETSSILKLITERFNLEPLPSPRVQAVTSLAQALALD